jgi:DNA polymerase sigma
MNDKYKMFKNFLHNELGLTKEDIREWIREAISEEVRKVVKESYEKCDIREVLKTEIKSVLTKYDWFGSDLKESIQKLAVAEMTKGYVFDIKRKDEKIY